MIISSEKYYTAEDIATQKLFPWTQNVRVIRNYLAALVQVREHKKYSIVLKPGNVDGISKRHGNRYYIKGQGIARIINDFENGILFGG